MVKKELGVVISIQNNTKQKTESSKNFQIAVVGSAIVTGLIYYFIINPYMHSIWKYLVTVFIFMVGVGYGTNSLNKQSAYKNLADAKTVSTGDKKDDAISILNRRYAKGEITKKEYLEMKKRIK